MTMSRREYVLTFIRRTIIVLLGVGLVEVLLMLRPS